MLQFLIIAAMMLLGPDLLPPGQLLLDRLKNTYPVAWQGTVTWSSVDQPEDLVMYAMVSLPERRYILGLIQFDGTNEVTECSDDQLRVRYIEKKPYLLPQSYSALLKVAPAFAYEYLRNPNKYVVQLDDDAGEYVVNGLADAYNVRFSMQDGRVLSATDTEGYVTISFSKYKTIGNCPWPTECRISSNRSGEYFDLRCDVSLSALDPAMFDFTKYHTEQSTDSDGKGIIYYRGQSMLESEARSREWPDTVAEWNDIELAARQQDPHSIKRTQRPTAPAELTFKMYSPVCLVAGFIMLGFGFARLAYDAAGRKRIVQSDSL